MMKNWRGVLAFLSLLMLIGATFWDVAASAQVFKDFSFGRWGESRESLKLNREEAVSRYNYCPTGGCVVRLDSLELRPMAARKGETLTLTTTYTILTPEKVAIPVVITREILYQGNSLGKARGVDTRNYNGTWNQQIDFTLPTNASPGIYTLVTRVSTGYGSDQKSIQFTVE
jgi:hypothetical protein